MIVQVKGKGVKLSGKWCFKGEEAEIDEIEYEKNKEYVDIIKEDIKEPQIPQVPNQNDQDEEEIKLQELRTKAKELGIRNYHLMGKDKLEAAIAEKEAPLFGTKKEENPDENLNPDKNEGGSDTNVDGNEDKTGEENPQE